MLYGFEKITADLSDYERYTLLPIMTKCLERKVGKENAITNRVICEKMSECGYDIGEVRVRKIINYIRVMDLVPRLLATSKGYYVSRDKKELSLYIESLKDRAAAILAVADALKRQMDGLDTKTIC